MMTGGDGHTGLDWTTGLWGMRKRPRVWTSLCRCHPASGGVCRRKGDAVGEVWAGVVVTAAEAGGNGG